MAKFYGPVGYAETVETAPGVYVEKITERMLSLIHISEPTRH